MRRGVGLALLIVYAAWAWHGWTAGRAYARAHASARRGDLDRSLADLAAVGRGPWGFEASWLEGEVRLGIWDSWTAERRRAEGETMLAAAVRAYLRASEQAPSSAWPWIGMADAWERRGRAEREQRPVDLGTMTVSWASATGDDRIAAGLARISARLEPHNFRTLDRRVLLARRLRVASELREAVASTARALPAWDLHDDLRALDGNRTVLDSFWGPARDAAAPMLPEERRRFYLGTLALRLGMDDEAERQLRAALRSPGGALQRAEVSWHLGGLLLRSGREAEALELLSRAEREPVFRRAVRLRRAQYALGAGRTEDALRDLEAALDESPGDIEVVLLYASAAVPVQRGAEAEDRIRRAIGEHPDQESLRSALVDVLLRSGASAEADRALADWRGALGETPAFEAARRRVEAVAGDR
jgi:tetratricopeptide (TPR) repeat protein